jgi:hypothetical protein
MSVNFILSYEIPPGSFVLYCSRIIIEKIICSLRSGPFIVIFKYNTWCGFLGRPAYPPSVYCSCETGTGKQRRGEGYTSFGVSKRHPAEAELPAFPEQNFLIPTSGVSPEAMISCPNRANYFFCGITGICR